MSLAKNSFYNILGFAIPTLFAIPSLGILGRILGLESFGLFTLAFAVVGYASIFDGGITRAVIREISIFRNDKVEQEKIISTASFVVLILSIFATSLLYFGAEALTTFLNVSDDNYEQIVNSFKLLSVVIPIFLISQIWIAFLEGHERFINLNVQRALSGIAISVIPVIFCLIEPNILYAIAGLVVGRIISFIIAFYACKKIIIQSKISFNKVVFHRLMTFGGWVTVSNIISPIMVYFDRFITSNIVGATNVALYSAPAEGVIKASNLPFALARALFPRLSYITNEEEKKKLERQSYLYISIACIPVVVIGSIFAPEIMKLWMGDKFGGIDAQVLRVLLVGFYLNGLASIPFSLLQSRGNARITALIHLIEVVPYLGLLYFMTTNHGIIGTAIAWSTRMFVDLIAMYTLSRKI